MNLAIQVSNPTVAATDGFAADMADAISQMYPLESEDAVLIWNLIPIRLSYGYDIPALVDDLVPLLEEIQETDYRTGDVYWASDTFSAEWSLGKSGNELTITANWISALGNYEDLLNARNVIQTDVHTFVQEFTKILTRTVSDIKD